MTILEATLLVAGVAVSMTFVVYCLAAIAGLAFIGGVFVSFIRRLR